MNLTTTTYTKDFFNALISKCHRYRWFLFGAIAAAIITTIAGSFFENRYFYLGGGNDYDVIYLGSPVSIIMPMLIAVALVVLINLPNEQRYQLSCAKGRFTPMLVNMTIAMVLTFTFALITAFVPAFIATCGIVSAITGNGYYDNLIFSSSELLLDFGYCLVISWIVIGSANKFMYYLKANPKLIMLWVASIGAVFGLVMLTLYLMADSPIDIEINALSTFIFMLISVLLYEGINATIRMIALRKGDISR